MELLQMENIIRTKLSVMVPRLLNNRFPNISFTDEINYEIPSFPNVYVHELEPVEVGNDLENNKIHAIRESLQIEVKTNTSKNDGRIVMSAVVKAIKSMGFSLNMLPIYNKENNLHRFIIRVNRIIASGDEI